MWHRLRIGTLAGEECGYQWRDIDFALFAAVLAGERPLGDAEAQSRDSTDWDTAAQNRAMHYLAVWNTDTQAWSTGSESADTAYTAWAAAGAGS